MKIKRYAGTDGNFLSHAHYRDPYVGMCMICYIAYILINCYSGFMCKFEFALQELINQLFHKYV